MTSIFGTLEVMMLPDNQWQYTSSPTYLLNSGRSVQIRRGFICDFGSIPKPAWSVVGCPMDPRGVRAYGLHDYLYYRSREGYTDWTRRDVDLAMLEVLLFDGMPEIIAYGVYSAVRAGAFKAWGRGEPDEDINLLEDPEGFEWFRE